MAETNYDTLLDPQKIEKREIFGSYAHNKTALDKMASEDPEAMFTGKPKAHPANLDWTKEINNPNSIVDAQIMECDDQGRYILKSYDKEKLFQRLQHAPIIEVHDSPRPLTLQEKAGLILAKLREDIGSSGSDQPMGGVEPFANFTPLFMGPYYRQQYLYQMLEAKSKCYEAYVNNPIAHRIPNLITQFTLGKGVTAHARNDKTQRAWDHFAKMNKLGTSMSVGLTRAGSRLRMWSNQLSVDGELMVQFVDKQDYLYMHNLDTATILEIVTDPEDIDKIFYYHQQMCLDGDTKIALIDGTNPTIREMSERWAAGDVDMWCYSYDAENHKIVPGKVDMARETGRKQCYKVTLDNGESVIASFDHPFLTRDGKYIWASKLEVGQALMPLYKRQGYEEIYQPTGVWEPTHQVVNREEQRSKIIAGNAKKQQDPEYRNHKVSKVEKWDERPVFDLTIAKYHNFALTCGVFTHNTTPFQMYITNNIPSIKYIIRQIPGNDVLHMKINTYENEKRGRSDLYSVIGWIKRYKDLVNANVIKAYFQSCYTWDLTVDGSPQQIQLMAAAAQGQIPTPGSQYIHNKNITRQFMPPGAATGAGSDQDQIGLMNLISLGTGVPPAYLIGTMAANRAGVLTETEPSTKFFFERQSVFDEALHSMFERLAKWHYSKTGEMLDENIEFAFPPINAMDRTVMLNSLGTMVQSKWFTNRRAAELAAKEFNATSYTFDQEQKDIQAEQQEAMDYELAANKQKSAAQSHLTLWQNMLSHNAAQEEQDTLGYNVGGQSGGDAQAQQQSEMQSNEHQAAIGAAGKAHVVTASAKAKGKPAGKKGGAGAKTSGKKPALNAAKGESNSGGLTDGERAATKAKVSAGGKD